MTSGRGDDEADAANGTEAFGEFFKRHFERAKYGVVDSAEFRASYAEAFPEAAAKVDWDAWLSSPGMPPVDVGAYYDGASSAASGALARKWHLRCPGMGAADHRGGRPDVADFGRRRWTTFCFPVGAPRRVIRPHRRRAQPGRAVQAGRV